MTATFEHVTPGPDGDTVIDGTGLRVYTIVGLYETGNSAEFIATEYEVPVGAVFEALAYASRHPEEMEAIQRADRATEQESLRQMPPKVRQMAEDVLEADERAYQEAVRRAREARHGAPVS